MAVWRTVILHNPCEWSKIRLYRNVPMNCTTSRSQARWSTTSSNKLAPRVPLEVKIYRLRNKRAHSSPTSCRNRKRISSHLGLLNKGSIESRSLSRRGRMVNCASPSIGTWSMKLWTRRVALRLSWNPRERRRETRKFSGQCRATTITITKGIVKSDPTALRRPTSGPETAANRRW